MPRQTNLFQEVVEIIHSHMAEGATVEPSAMLRNERTGQDREVDVVIRSRSAGYEVIVSVEAVGRSRAASVEWVEQMVAKHKNLPTNKLVLVSEKGFAKQARALAESEGAVALAPEDLSGGDPAGRVVAAAKSLWPKIVTFEMHSISVKFDDDAPKDGWSKESPPVYADDSSRLADTIDEFVKRLYQDRFPDLMEQIGLADIAEDEERDFMLVVENLRPRVASVERHACLLNENGRLYSLKRITVAGKGRIQVSEIPLKHGRLGEVQTLFSYGQGKVAGRDALVVFSTTEGEEQGKLTFRIRPDPRA